MVELFANSGDPDQTRHSMASDLGLHCLPMALLGVSNGLSSQLRIRCFFIQPAGIYNFLISPRNIYHGYS